MTKIAMWSGPRSISTALMRSFENRPDTFVSDEPFYAHYLHETEEDHPYSKETILQGETNWAMVAKYITGDIPRGKKVWYQKHMVLHNLPGNDLSWIGKMHNIILIRHPREVILSYIKKYEIRNVLQLGYRQLTSLFTMLKERSGVVPLIIDARDVLKDPEGILKELCGRVYIPFYKEMLSWPAGRRDSDGIWGKHWYGDVERSTRFKKYVINNDIVSPDLKSIFADCMDCYQQLYQHRMRVV